MLIRKMMIAFILIIPRISTLFWLSPQSTGNQSIPWIRSCFKSAINQSLVDLLSKFEFMINNEKCLRYETSLADICCRKWLRMDILFLKMQKGHVSPNFIWTIVTFKLERTILTYYLEPMEISPAKTLMLNHSND